MPVRFLRTPVLMLAAAIGIGALPAFAQTTVLPPGPPLRSYSPGEVELLKGIRLGMAGNLAAAEALFRQSCDLGNVKGCVQLGNVLVNRPKATRDEMGAIGFFSKACAPNDQLSCIWSGVAPAQIEMMPEKFQKQVLILNGMACDPKDPETLSNCLFAGLIETFGVASQRNPAAGEAHLKATCDSDLATGCYYLAQSKLAKNGAEPNKEASKLFAKACKLGFRSACDQTQSVSGQPNRF